MTLVYLVLNDCARISWNKIWPAVKSHESFNSIAMPGSMPDLAMQLARHIRLYVQQRRY